MAFSVSILNAEKELNEMVMHTCACTCSRVQSHMNLQFINDLSVNRRGLDDQNSNLYGHFRIASLQGPLFLFQ